MSCQELHSEQPEMKILHLHSKLFLSGKGNSASLKPFDGGGTDHLPAGAAFPALGTVEMSRAPLEDIHLTVQECLAVLKVSTAAGFQNRRCFLLFETQTLLHCALTREPVSDRGQDYVCLPYSHSLRMELCQNKQMVSS